MTDRMLSCWPHTPPRRQSARAALPVNGESLAETFARRCAGLGDQRELARFAHNNLDLVSGLGID
jgi:hypothetical protein